MTEFSIKNEAEAFFINQENGQPRGQANERFERGETNI